MKETTKYREKLAFTPITLTDVLKENNSLNFSKATQPSDITVKLLKDNKVFFATFKTNCFKNSLDSESFIIV